MLVYKHRWIIAGDLILSTIAYLIILIFSWLIFRFKMIESGFVIYLLLAFCMLAIMSLLLREWQLNSLRRKHQVNIRAGFFTFYSQEIICTTHSEKKRSFMRFSNFLTLLLLICLALSFLSIALLVTNWLSGLLDNL